MTLKKSSCTIWNYDSKQKGYVTVLTLILFSVLSLSLLAMFNSGQVVTHKLKLQNAVDAAAYSSAGIVSRELNYMAYTNRAMIANQVAVGQMVGLASWNKMMVHASGNISKVVAPLAAIPGIGVLITGYFNGMKAVSNVAEATIIAFLNKAAIPLTNAVIQALSISQDAVHIATQGLILTTYPAVLKDNDPDAVMGIIGGANLLKNQQKVRDFTRRTSEAKPGSSDLGSYDKFATVVKDSRDNFTGGRSYKWLGKLEFPLVIRAWIRKRGGNEFDRKLEGGKYVWDWSAMDTVSLWTEVFSWDPKDFGWQGERETLPIGWGAAHTSNTSSRYSNYNSSSKWDRARRNAMSGSLADSTYGTNRLSFTSGLQRFYHINGTIKNPTPPAFIAVAAKDAGSMKTWKEVVKDSGGGVSGRLDIEEKGNLLSSKMYVLAKSEPYFSRSYDLASFRRADLNMEYGNLFNPYWQSRLTDLTPAEKTSVLLLLPK